MGRIIKREEQRKEDTWNLEAIYANDELWQEDMKTVQKKMEALGQYREHFLDSAAAMADGLDAMCEIKELYGRLMVYASMRLHENTANAHYQSLAGMCQVLSSKIGAAMSWIEPMVLSVSDEKLASYMAEEKRLQLYRVYISGILRQKGHTLDPEKEKMLADAMQLGAAPSTVYSMLCNADLRFPAVVNEGETYPLTSGTFVPLQENQNRAVRKDAFEKLYNTYASFGNTIAALYDANVRQTAFFAEERHYGSSREAMLDESEIPVSVYDSLIDTVHQNFSSMHRYVKLRKQCLAMDELHMYDVYCPLVHGADRKYSFEEAKEIALSGLKILGEDYLNIVREGLSNRWIDIYENEGKRSGAYSWGSYGTDPYILLNYQGTLDNVFTLVHEMGHSVHSYLSRKNQPYIYSDYHIFVAEVASTCNEVLLMLSLLEKTEDRAERLFLLNHFMEQFKGTVFRQTMFAEFEKLTHEAASAGETLTAERLCELYLSLNRQYFGEDMVSDSEIAWEWARIPHFYTPFYVYQYATGMSAAVAIAIKIWKQEKGILEKYKTFLSGGSSQSPIELLKICGVDMTSSQPVQDALTMFAEYLEKFACELEK